MTKGGDERKWWPFGEVVTKVSGDEGKCGPRDMVTKGSGDEGKSGD